MRTQATIKRTGFPAVSILFLTWAFSFSLASVLSAVRGYVKESTTGAPLADVKLTLVSLKNNSVKFELRTDKSGYFVKTGLQKGMYRLTADKTSYMPVQTTIRLKAADLYEADLRLEALGTEISTTSVESIDTAKKMMRAGKYDEALEIMTRTIDQEPGNFILYYYFEPISMTKKAITKRPLRTLKNPWH